MTVVNMHGRQEQDQRPATPWSSWFFGKPGLASLKFWLTGIAFLALYLACNKLTESRELDGLGITLWSPDNGLSLALLTEGAMFAPFVFLGAVLADTFVAGVHHHLSVTVAAEIVLTACYVALAAMLRLKLKFNLRQIRLADVVVLLIFLPAGAALTSLSYCGALYLGGSLPADQFFVAMRHFWIGDTLGMITIIPLLAALFAVLSMPTWQWSSYTLFSCSVFTLGTCLAFAAIIGVAASLLRHWIGIQPHPVGKYLRNEKSCL